MQDMSADFWSQADAVGRAVAALLLLMSVSAWVVIFWKGWVLQRAQRDLARAVPAFWDAGTLDDGRQRLAAMDREHVLLPLLDAATAHPGIGSAGELGPARFAAHAAAARRAAPRPGASAVRPGAAGVDRQHGAVRRPVRHRLGHLPRAGRHFAGRQHHHREGRRPDRRGADHDGRRPGRGHPGGAGLQRLRQAGRRPARPSSRASRTTCARWSWTRNASNPEPWHSAASNATPARGR